MLRWKSAIVAFMLSLIAVAQAGSQTDDDAKKAVDAFKTAYADGFKKNDESARASAVSNLANVYQAIATKALLGVLSSDPSVQVQKAAALALARPADDVAIQGLGAVVEANKSNKKAGDLLCALAAALGDCNSEHGLDTLHGMFGHYKEDVAKEAVNAVAKIGSPNSIQPLLQLLRKSDQERSKTVGGGLVGGANQPSSTKDKDLENLYEPVKKALAACSGGEGKDYKEWDNWWKQHQGSLKYSQVFWCPGTRQTFEIKPGDKKTCPYDADKVKDCGVLLKRKVVQ